MDRFLGAGVRAKLNEVENYMRWLLTFGDDSPSGGSRFRSDSEVQLAFFPSFVPGKYHCPVLYNVLSNNTHIVANKVTGNVFSYEVGEVVHNLQGYSHSGHNLSPHGLHHTKWVLFKVN